MPQFRRTTLILALLLSVASSAVAYTVYFKDGSRVIAKEPYSVEGDQAIIVLRNGTTASYPAAEIDIERTREANQSEYGSALVLEGGRFTEMPATAAPPRQRRLTDAIESGEARLRNREQPTRSTRPDVNRTASTRSFLDAERAPFDGAEIADEIVQQFGVQGLGGIQVFQGSSNDRVLFDVTTNTEASVFLGLEVAAKTLLRLEQLYPGTVSAFEIVMRSDRGELGGQFELTRELAAALADGSVDSSTFFIENVIF